MSYQSGEVADILRGARQIVDAGWCKYRAQDGNKYCMVGAVFKAQTGYSHIMSNNPAGREALYLLMKCLPWTPVPENTQYDWAAQVLPKFNDDDETTKEDVLIVFDKALAELGEL